MPHTMVNGINLYYEVHGIGQPLVMIMGIGTDQTAWRKQVPEFSKHFQVITFDNRGVGKSDKPKGPYSAKLLAKDTIKLMDYLNVDKAHILGASMGGLIAQEIAINFPDRVLDLALACTWCCQDDGENGITPPMLEATKLDPIQGMSRLIDAAFNKFFNRFILAPLIKFQIRKMKEPETTGMEGQVECVKAYNSFDRLSRVKARTLVITGTEDRVIKPESSDTIAKQIFNAKLVKLKTGSHVFCIEKSKTFNKEVLEFLLSG